MEDTQACPSTPDSEHLAEKPARARAAGRLSSDVYVGRENSIHHPLLDAISEAANVLESDNNFYAPPPLGGGGAEKCYSAYNYR